MTQDKKFLGTEPVGRLLWRLAVPTVIAQLVNMLYNIVDRIYIGHIPETGSMALTGVGVCLPIIMIISAFAAFVSSGGAPRASIAMGRGDYDQAQRILGGCFTLQVAISLVLTAVLLIWNRPLLLTFGASGNTIEYAAQYMGVYALGTLFVELTLGLNAFITAQGFAQVGMKTVLIGAVANILLDPLFIFGLDMGMTGAALATILGQIASFCISMRYLFHFKSVPFSRGCFTIDGDRTRKIFSYGASACFNQIAMAVVQIVLNNTLAHYGALSIYGSDIPLACAGIISKVNMIFMSFVIGISQGVQPIIGFNYGAALYRRVKKSYLLALAVATGLSLAAFACFQLFPRQIISIFGTGSEMYYQFSERYFRIYMFLTLINGIQPVTSNFFNSIGKARLGVFMSLTRQILFLLPLIVIFPLFMGIDGVMYAGPIADGAAAIVCGLFTVRELRELTRLQQKTEKTN